VRREYRNLTPEEEALVSPEVQAERFFKTWRKGGAAALEKLLEQRQKELAEVEENVRQRGRL